MNRERLNLPSLQKTFKHKLLRIRLPHGLEPSGIRIGLRNVRLFWRAVWHFRAYDFDGLLALIEAAARAMRDSHRNDQVHVDAARTTRHLTIVAELCRRLRADDYFHNAGYDPETWRNVPPEKRQRIAAHTVYMMKEDAVQLGKMLRFVQHWWN